MLKKTSRWLVRGIAAACMVLAVTSACLIYQERETLSRLGHPGINLKATEIYSRWLELTPQNPISWTRALGWLSALDYHIL